MAHLFSLNYISFARTCPDVATKHCIAHRWYPQYRFLNFCNSLYSFPLSFPFIYCTTFDMERNGDPEISICIRSELTFPPTMFIQLIETYFPYRVCKIIAQNTMRHSISYTLYKLPLYIMSHIILRSSPKGEVFTLPAFWE